MGLGLGGALVTVAFLKTLGLVHDVVWEHVPDALGTDPFDAVYVLPACALGGALVGLARRHLGEHPETLEAALARFKRDHAFDHRHLPNVAVTSLLSLGFGAALGPEAALVAIVGGLSSWIARVIRTGATAGASLDYIGIVGSLGALFGTAGVVALPLDEGAARPKRVWLIVPGLLAAVAGLLVFRAFSDGDRYFDYSLPTYEFSLVDLAWALPAAVAGFLVTAACLVMMRATARVADMLGERKVLQSLSAGVVFGVLASASSLVLFSGHEGIQELIDDDATSSTGFLIAIAVAKMVAVAVLVSGGWKGGRFFPVMFAGAAAGLAVAHTLDGLVPLVALAAGMTAAVGALIRKPVAAALLVAFIFPPDTYGAVALAAVVGSALGAVLVRRVPALDEPDPVLVAEAEGGGLGQAG